MARQALHAPYVDKLHDVPVMLVTTANICQVTGRRGNTCQNAVACLLSAEQLLPAPVTHVCCSMVWCDPGTGWPCTHSNSLSFSRTLHKSNIEYCTCCIATLPRCSKQALPRQQHSAATSCHTSYVCSQVHQVDAANAKPQLTACPRLLARCRHTH